MVQEKKGEGSQQVKHVLKVPKPILASSDPLFGVLEEDQVGVNPITGRPRIAPDVLEGMRQYLMVSNGPERIIREERVKTSFKAVEKDLIAQKTILRLEPPLIVSHDLDKGKGLVFYFEK